MIRKMVLVAAALAPLAAQATTGYFQHGYGIKAKSMGGVGIALPQDALAAATNPAGIAWVGNRIDIGVDLFMPDRGSSIVGNGAGLNGTYDGNDTKSFLIPEFGYHRVINPNLTFGVAVYGNGGMNTDYKTNPFAAFGGTGSAGVDLMQLFVAPTVAWKSGNHAFGVSLNLAYQRFKAEGLQPFDNAMFSSSPGNVTNRGYDDSTGFGVRLGWTGQVSPMVTLGATYQTKTKMSEFDKYRGLFANQGDFDIPENYNIGVSWQASPALRVALDYQRINYSKVNSVGNATLPNFYTDGLGTDNGAGFGWDDMDIFKLGVEYKYNKQWMFRAGYSHGNNPIEGSLAAVCSGMTPTPPCGEVTFNILAPAVIENHVTLGFTYTSASGNELTVAYMHGFKNDVNGVRPPPFNNMSPGSVDTIQMYQNAIGLQYSWKM